MEEALEAQQRRLAAERASLSAQLAEQESEMQKMVRRFDDRVMALERRTTEISSQQAEQQAGNQHGNGLIQRQQRGTGWVHQRE